MDILAFIYGISILQAVILISGMVLVIIEMFHPGFGAPGITGLILLVAGVVLIARNLLEAFILIIIIIAVLGTALALVLKSATKGHLSKTLILNTELKKEAGFVGTEDLDIFLGKEGSAMTVLRPSGTGDFDDVKLDVVTQGEFISMGSRIKVIKVEGRRIVVKEI